MDVSNGSNIISVLLFLHLSQMARQIDVGWLRFYLNWWMRISLCNAVVRNLHMLIYLLYWLWIRINDEGHKARCIIHRTLGPIFINLKTFLLTKSKALFLILNWTWFSFKILVLQDVVIFLRQKNVNLRYFWWKVCRNFLCSVSCYKNFKENV